MDEGLHIKADKAWPYDTKDCRCSGWYKCLWCSYLSSMWRMLVTSDV